MLTLYHGGASVCSVKAQLALVEKGLDWEDVLFDLQAQEHLNPQYLALNPEGVVPTLIHDGVVVRESSAIIVYLDRLSPENPLMPQDNQGFATTLTWLARTIEIHAAINSVTFASVQRARYRAKYSAEEIEARVSALPNPERAQKRRNVFAHGAQSPYVGGALHTFDQMFADMQKALERTEWLAGDRFSLSDLALAAYVDRLELLEMSGLWTDRYPLVNRWLDHIHARPSWQTIISRYRSAESDAPTRELARKFWPELAAVMEDTATA